MTRPDPNDDLLQRYHEASAQDDARPSAHVRDAVRAHAEMMARQHNAHTAPAATSTPAANQPRWKLSLLASIALAGLTGLLVVQFDRGTPEEQEAAYGRPAPSAAPPPVVQESAPPAAPAAPRPAPARQSAQAPQKATADARSPAPATAREATRNAPLPATQEAASLPAANTAAAPEPSPAVPPPAAFPAAPRPAPAAPSAAFRMPQQQQDNAGLQAPRARAESAAARDPSAALHDAARAGRLTQLEGLLREGAPINAPDAAGRTALVLAVINGHAAMVQRLMALGANPALVDKEGFNALQHARRLGLGGIAAMLEAGS
ncbi:MAG: ankyrin repeat domain-containing protein [Polaromonas sp.]|nr:ankyrin repeat domain-containing protein [Polaromonas sp.]